MTLGLPFSGSYHSYFEILLVVSSFDSSFSSKSHAWFKGCHYNSNTWVIMSWQKQIMPQLKDIDHKHVCWADMQPQLKARLLLLSLCGTDQHRIVSILLLLWNWKTRDVVVYIHAVLRSNYTMKKSGVYIYICIKVYTCKWCAWKKITVEGRRSFFGSSSSCVLYYQCKVCLSSQKFSSQAAGERRR